MIEVIAKGGNIVPHIHLPVQSGNNAVLKIMGRKYTRESYLDLVNRIKKSIPNVALTTDIIVDIQTKLKNNLKRHYHYMTKFNLSMLIRIYTLKGWYTCRKMKDNVPEDVKKHDYNV